MITGLIYMFSYESRATKADLNSLIVNSPDEKLMLDDIYIFYPFCISLDLVLTQYVARFTNWSWNSNKIAIFTIIAS